jgi:SAM-dependent methyltransferase
MQNNPELFNPAYTVVEVGSGPFGIAQFLGRPVIGVEPDKISSGSGHLEIIQGSVVSLPFDDQEIDFVLCIDVLEHLLPDIRQKAINELLRICRQRVIISCPCHRWAKSGEHALRNMFEHYNMPIPGWLQEHLDYELPIINEILDPIAETGYKFQVLGNETMLQHYAGIAMDWMFPMAGGLNDRINRKSRWTAPILGNEWDLYYSFMFSIFKQRRSQGAEWSETRRRSRLQQSIVHDGTSPKIYAVYHTDFPIDHLGKITPIFAGPAAARATAGQLTDRLSGDESLPNKRWSELSAIYKIWKDGPRSAVVGFCHYRRLFDFRPNARQLTGGVRDTHLPKEQLSSCTDQLFDEYMLKSIGHNTLIVAMTTGVEGNIFDQYCEIHNTNDYLDIFNQVALSDSPLLGGFLEQFSTDRLYANNLFVTSWDLFCELCEFWFTYLGRFADKLPRRDTADYHQRDISFLSERIFDAWVRYRKSAGTEIIELPIFFIT